MNQADELQQIQQALQGDLEAFNQLVLEYQTTVYHYTFWLVRNRETAEDLTQEAFIRAFQNLRSYRGGSFRAWLMRIAGNASLDELRRQQKRQTLSLTSFNDDAEEVDTDVWLRDPGASVEETIEQQEFRRDLQQYIDELPDEYRRALLLVDVFEMDYNEAAAAMGVPIGTVKSRLARARLLLRQRLQNAAQQQFSPVFQSA